MCQPLTIRSSVTTSSCSSPAASIHHLSTGRSSVTESSFNSQMTSTCTPSIGESRVTDTSSCSPKLDSSATDISHSTSPSPCFSETSVEKGTSCLLPLSDNLSSEHSVEGLLILFKETFSVQQIDLVWYLSNNDFEMAFECLSSGPTLDSLLHVQSLQHLGKKPFKVYVDLEDKWADLISVYKVPDFDFGRPIRIIMEGAPAIDQGGMRCEVFTDVYSSFAANEFVQLFEGTPTCLRPLYTAEARSSGLFKVLGQMIAHSISMDGVGFPHLSPTCYWYIAEGEDRALQFVEEGDVGADVYHLVKKVKFCR